MMKKFILTCVTFLMCAVCYSQNTVNRSEAQALELVTSLFDKAKSGADFAGLAAQYSEDPGSKANGGKYANCEFGTFTPVFEAVVQELAINQISKPFWSPYGYHIVQVLAKTSTTFTVRHILVQYNATAGG